MNINFVEDKKGLVVFEVRGVNHGFCNLLKDELTKDNSVELATYKIDHPLVGVPKIRVEGTDAKASIKKAVKNLKKEVETFKKEASKVK